MPLSQPAGYDCLPDPPKLVLPACTAYDVPSPGKSDELSLCLANREIEIGCYGDTSDASSIRFCRKDLKVRLWPLGVTWNAANLEAGNADRQTRDEVL